MKSIVKKAVACFTGLAAFAAAGFCTAAPFAAEGVISVPVISSTAPGILTAKNGKTTIDYSNHREGYVMVNYAADAKLKVRVKGPVQTYTYDLNANTWEAFPFSEGSGAYTVSVFRNVDGNRYVSELSKTIQVELYSEKVPFVHSNQYVDFDHAPNAVAKAAELTADKPQALDKVAAIYDYVVSNVAYDYELAKTVQTGYLPKLDQVLETQKGICFDYASLMTGMLRSQGVPTKLVIGYAGTVYHAWISIWVDGQGWVDGAIYFDGTSWKRMDPTFASTSNKSNAIMQYITDDANYSERYCY